MGGIVASANNAAVAGTVRPATNDPGILEEKTEITTAPAIPDKSEDTSAATIGFCNKTKLLEIHNKEDNKFKCYRDKIIFQYILKLY